MAGTAQEAAMVAGALPLGRLAVLANLPDTGTQEAGALAARRRMLAGFTARGVDGADHRGRR